MQGKFERGFLSTDIESQVDKDRVVTLKTESGVQMVWWILNLRALALVHIRILDPIVPTGQIDPLLRRCRRQ